MSSLLVLLYCKSIISAHRCSCQQMQFSGERQFQDKPKVAITGCAVGSTVVTMTTKVNGKMEILTPCRSETPENTEISV